MSWHTIFKTIAKHPGGTGFESGISHNDPDALQTTEGAIPVSSFFGLHFSGASNFVTNFSYNFFNLLRILKKSYKRQPGLTVEADISALHTDGVVRGPVVKDIRGLHHLHTGYRGGC